MQYTVHQQITVQQLKVNDISNSSILQIGSSGSMEGYSVVGADSTVTGADGQEQKGGAVAPFKPTGKKGGKPSGGPMPGMSVPYGGYGGYPAQSAPGWPGTAVDDPPFVTNELDPVFVPLPLPILGVW